MSLRGGLTAASLAVAALAIFSLTQQSSSSQRAAFISRAQPSVVSWGTPSHGKPAHPRSTPTQLPPATKMQSPAQEAAPALTAVPLQRMVGQQLMVRMTGTSPDPSLLARVRDGEIGGVIIYAENIVSQLQLSALDADLQAAARAGGNPPLLISTDQEGGQVKRLPWAAPTFAASDMGAQGTAVSESQGRATGAALHAVGINVNLAPVADVAHSASAFIWQQQRSFGMSATTVRDATVAFARGMESEGVAPTAKHFPGVGAALTDTDYALQRLTVSSEDLMPYRALISAQIPVIMVSTAVYENLDPARPAALSSAVIGGLLRQQLGYRGVVITDDLERPTGQSSPGAAAVRADQAGADIILVSTTESAGSAAYGAMLAAAQSGTIPGSTIAEAYQRILVLKQHYAGASVAAR